MYADHADVVCLEQTPRIPKKKKKSEVSQNRPKANQVMGGINRRTTTWIKGREAGGGCACVWHRVRALALQQLLAVAAFAPVGGCAMISKDREGTRVGTEQ